MRPLQPHPAGQVRVGCTHGGCLCVDMQEQLWSRISPCCTGWSGLTVSELYSGPVPHPSTSLPTTILAPCRFGVTNSEFADLTEVYNTAAEQLGPPEGALLIERVLQPFAQARRRVGARALPLILRRQC